MNEARFLQEKYEFRLRISSQWSFLYHIWQIIQSKANDVICHIINDSSRLGKLNVTTDG